MMMKITYTITRNACTAMTHALLFLSNNHDAQVCNDTVPHSEAVRKFPSHCARVGLNLGYTLAHNAQTRPRHTETDLRGPMAETSNHTHERHVARSASRYPMGLRVL